MKKIFILLLIAIFTCSVQARPHHSWHHRDWLGLTIGAAIVTAIATTPPTPTVQETVIVAQPAPIIVQQPPTPIVTTTPIIVQQPAPIIVQQPTYVAPVVRPMPSPPPPPPPHWRRLPLPPPPPRRHHRPAYRR